MEKKNIYEKLMEIQSSLKAPKNQRNSFGNYNYRSCEDIFEAVKPYLKENNLILTITDDLVHIGERYYIKATAILTDGETTITNVSYAREDETKKGMDGSQITGASSSYARKYALNGLFLIDDVKDSDSTNTGKEKEEKTNTNRIMLINQINDLERELDIPHEKILEKGKVNSLNEMTDSQLKQCVLGLEQVKKGKE